MEAPDPSALESILPEVHDVFSERQAERDLAIIKKVKKIDTDTRQIVTNREAEIKEVVRALAQRVEKDEDAAANEDEVREVSERVNLAAEEKQQLQTQIEELTVDKENILAQVQAQRADNSHIQQKREQVEKDVSKEIPQNKGLLHLYNNISKIRWDSECADETRWKGIIVPELHEPDQTPREFDIQTKVMSEFEACNALWEAIG